VKFGVAFGARTSVISDDTSKKTSALEDLVARAYIDGTKTEEMRAAAGKSDFILSTIPAEYDVGEINVAFERTVKSHVKYRFVIDIATL
jgi:D-arabinose 1-dehydrogenase-like Zn-dependent alcohol dehydrogenase